MQCPECKLENQPGAFYCARCHKALPRPPAPGECLFCGRIPSPGEPIPENCPSCGNDGERGKQVREARITALRLEVEQETIALQAKQDTLTVGKKSKGCGLTLFLLGVVVLASWRTGDHRQLPKAPVPANGAVALRKV